MCCEGRGHLNQFKSGVVILSDIDSDIHLHKSPSPHFLVHMCAPNCDYKATLVSSGWPNKTKDITTDSLITGDTAVICSGRTHWSGGGPFDN